MHKIAPVFFHNLDTCIGCGACQVACKDCNGLSGGEFFRRVCEVTLRDGTKRFSSGACNHCENPACMAICPNGAFYKSAEGLVLHDNRKCIGCGRCVWSCPYGAISLSLQHGTAQKCLGCEQYRSRGEEPPCVAACVTRSLKLKVPEDYPPENCRNSIPEVFPSPEQTSPRIVVGISQKGKSQ